MTTSIMGIQMKIRIRLLSIVLLTFFLLSGCCNCGNTAKEDNSVQGIITIIGNVPFTKLAIRTKDEKVFVLKCSKELKDELWKNQGNLYLIKFGDQREEEGMQTLIVEKVIPLNKNEN
jgi:hypothetical protein